MNLSWCGIQGVAMVAMVFYGNPSLGFSLVPASRSVPGTVSIPGKAGGSFVSHGAQTRAVSCSTPAICMGAKDHHKYIIVGGGTAGCVLANRLSEEKDNSVLVLEAGSPKFNDRNINIPAAIIRVLGSAFDWRFESQDEKYVSGDGIYLCRGKVLGGSSCTNVMLYHRGEEADYDAWEVDGWAGKDVLPFFKKAENNRSKQPGEYHGKGGPFHVEDTRYMNPLTKMFFRACDEAGIRKNEDFNDWSQPQEGYGRFQVAQKKGKRCSAASSYLKEARGRKNLAVKTGAQITKVLLEDNRATGVEYMQDGVKQIARLEAGGEVILAGGGISSPQVLLLSGIGPAEHLKSKNIEVKNNLPGVGKNLRDHPAITLQADVTKPISITDELFREGTGQLKPKTVLRWLLTGTGPLASPGVENGAFLATSANKAAPDVQFRFIPGRSPSSGNGINAYTSLGANVKRPSGVTVQVVAIRPKSHGHVELRSSDPFDKPVIVTNVLQNREDLASLTNGIEIAREVFDQPAFRGTIGAEAFPGKHGATELSEYIKSTVHSANAVVGTCKMGAESDEMAVVNSALQVKGMAGLRVIDASVMPCPPGGQTGAATIMIAEKAADLLKHP